MHGCVVIKLAIAGDEFELFYEIKVDINLLSLV